LAAPTPDEQEHVMKAVAAVLFALALAMLGAAAQAQSYPIKPIRVIVPYPPGNAADILPRLIGPKVSERLGQQLVVENRAGASGQIGLELVAHAAADGYTLGVGQGGNLAVAPHTYKKIPYDPLKDFVPVALLATNYLGLVANLEVPFKNVPEMIAWAKANPGKLTYASNGEGSFPHLGFELVGVMAGFKFTHIPYKGSAQIATDLMGGQVQVAMESFTSMAPQVRSGKLRILAITNDKRDPAQTDAPTVGEAVPGYELRGWFGVVAPAGTPRPAVLRLNEEFNRAMGLPEIREKMVASGLIVPNEPPEVFGELIRGDYAKFARLVKEIRFQAQ
jgi:tripartite-type tricarboxylate transporter receptor subunit TctC